MLKSWQIGVLESLGGWRDFVLEQNGSSADKKRQLIELAKSGERTRPHCKKHPLGPVFANYISPASQCYDAEFTAAIKAIAPSWFIDTVAENKKKLIELAKSGMPCRPHHKKHPLGPVFASYVNCKSCSYDPAFVEVIQNIAPAWLITDTATLNKEKIIQIAQSSGEKPHYKTKLGGALVSYLGKSQSSYDAEFERKLNDLAPHWFIDHAAENKKALIKLAKQGSARPTIPSELGKALVRYTKKDCYDKEFDKQIRNLAPHWFVDTVAESKQKLIEMAIKGEDRPVGSGPSRHYLGKTLCRYTNDSQSAYDKEFDKQIRQLAPHWFVDTATDNKKELLDLAKNNKPKPGRQSHLYNKLYAYIRVDGKCYDAEFACEIKNLAPHWFVISSADKKNRLIDLAKSSGGKPSCRTSLGNALLNYTDPKDGTYDAKFDKLIRTIAPHWFVFVDTAAENKKELLLLAKNGVSRPAYGKGKKGGIGKAFWRYVNPTQKTYDPEFVKQIKSIAPRWFVKISDTAEVRRKELLRLAKKGGPRPAASGNRKSTLGQALVRYTSKNKDCYNLEFDRQIRKLAPHWFG